MSVQENPATANTQLVAIALLVFGLTLAALNGAIMKGLTGGLPVLMIVWGRYTAYLIAMLPLALRAHGAAAFRPPRPGLQLVRIMFLLAGTFCFVSGVAGMRYADAIAIIYIYPFVLTLLSPVFLGERVSPASWLGVACGFVGVLIVMRPGLQGMNASALLVLACGVLLGFHMMMTRMLVRAVSPLITSTYTALVVVAVTSFAVPFVWQPPGQLQILMLAILGAVSAASQWFVLLAFSRAPAPVLAPFSYAEIPAAVVIGLIVFAELPDALAWTGIAIIIAGGLIVVRAPKMARTLERKRPPGL